MNRLKTLTYISIFVISPFFYFILNAEEIVGVAVTNPASEEEFVIIKNKNPLEMFEDANYLYNMGEYEGALILYNKVFTQTDDPVLKNRAKLGMEMADTLLKAERLGPAKAPKEYKRAVKIKERIKQERIDALYRQAFQQLYSQEYKEAMETFKQILNLDPKQQKARLYVEEKIPHTLELLKQSEIDRLYKEASVLFKNQDYEKSSEIYKRILALDPTQREARIYLEEKIPQGIKNKEISSLYKEAIDLFNNQNYTQASETLKRILALDPTQREARIYLEEKIPQSLERIKKEKIDQLYKQGFDFYCRHEYEKSIQTFKQILEIDPAQKEARFYAEEKIPQVVKDAKIEALYKQGIEYFVKQDYDKSSEVFRQILEIDPNQKEAKFYIEEKIPQAPQKSKIIALYQEAFGHFFNKDYDKAIQVFKQILELDPNQKEARFYAEEKIPQIMNRGKIEALYKEAKDYFDSQDYIASRDLFKQILELDPNQKEARFYLDKKIPEALAFIKRQKLDELYREAYALYRMQDYKGSAKAFKQILELDPNQKEARFYAEEKIPKILKNAKIESLYSQAFDYYNNQEYIKSAKAFKQILELDPKQKEARFYLDKKIPEALEIAKKNKINELYKKAIMLYNNRDYDASAKAFKQILKLDPNQEKARLYIQEKIPQLLKTAKIESLYSQGFDYFATADYEKSAQVFQEILQLDPNQKEARFYLDKKIPQAKEALKRGEIDAFYKEAYNYYRNQEYEKAAIVFEQILKIDPTQKEARVYLEQKIPRATRIVKKPAVISVVKERPTEAPKPTPPVAQIASLYRDAFVLYEIHNYVDAARIFKQILELDPKQHRARVYLEEKIPQAQKILDKEFEKAFQLAEKVEIKEQKIAIPEEIKVQKEREREQEGFVAIELPQVEIPMPTPKKELSAKERQALIKTPSNYPREGAVGVLYEEAFRHYRAREFAEAQSCFKKILLIEPREKIAQQYLDIIQTYFLH